VFFKYYFLLKAKDNYIRPTKDVPLTQGVTGRQNRSIF